MPKRKSSDSSSKKLVQQKITKIFPSSKGDKAASEKDNTKKKLKQTIIEEEQPNEIFVTPHENTLNSDRQESHLSSCQGILDDPEDEAFEEAEDLIYENNAVSHKISTMESEQEQEESLRDRIEIQSKLTFHDEEYTPIDKLLHAFDLNYAFGPCIGLTRLERWERAHRLNLNPPEEVRDALTINPELNKCIFSGRV